MTYTALVLASRRKGEVNPVAEMYGVSHKCIAPVDGVPMVERVVKALEGARHVDEIVISIDEPDVLKGIAVIDEGVAAGRIRCAPAGENLFLSVKAGLADAKWPAIITTADNVLHTSEIVDYFCEGFDKEGSDVAVAMTDIETVWAKYPQGQRRPHVFRDGAYSNCNLYGLRSPDALIAAKSFQSGGQFRKKRLRVLKEFGVLNFLRYWYGRFSFEDLFRRVSERFKVTVRPVILPFAEAPIDVDNERTEKVAREILVQRREAGETA